MRLFYHIILFFVAFLVMLTVMTECSNNKEKSITIFEKGVYPYATYYNGNYYYTMDPLEEGCIRIWQTDDLRKLGTADGKIVFIPKKHGLNMAHIWSPELHRIGSKWYLYFETDDGNTDNHQLYVLENGSENPLQGQFTLHGPIITNNDWNWGIHPSTIVIGGQQYLVWSGWQQRRKETEVQCIYIAKMKNPWTLASKRVKISQPDYDWERQWINYDGLSLAYPIYVNENPEIMLSRNGQHVIIYYSASGNWTIYTALGMLTAPADSDLLNPKNWHKSKEPVFASVPEDSIYSPSNICIVKGVDDNGLQLLYEARSPRNGQITKSVRLKNIHYDKNGFPVLGKPL